MRRPDTFSSQFTLLALLESRSVTGAYSFEVEPGEETRVRVHARLYFRRKVDKVGFAPLISMFWFGENTSNTFGDFRPEVHKSDGLLFQTDSGEWIWRPLAWIESPQVNIFANAGPKGYGLMQRDRDFSHYQDLNSLFHQMPSVWVQPVKGFNQGAVSLLQQPIHNDQADNVMAYWSPSVSPRPLEPVEIEYVLRWMTYSPELPPLGRCVSTRVDLQDEANRREIFLDFSGGPLDKVKQGDTPVPEVVSPNDAATISNVKIERMNLANPGASASWLSARETRSRSNSAAVCWSMAPRPAKPGPTRGIRKNQPPNGRGAVEAPLISRRPAYRRGGTSRPHRGGHHG